MRTPKTKPLVEGQKSRGRPPKEIDIVTLGKLAQIHCTIEEIADFFEVSHDTIERRLKHNDEFAVAYRSGLSRGKANLRRIQFRLAENGNAAMAIWLGKQWLGQRERPEDAVGGNDPLPWQD